MSRKSSISVCSRSLPAKQGGRPPAPGTNGPWRADTVLFVLAELGTSICFKDRTFAGYSARDAPAGCESIEPRTDSEPDRAETDSPSPAHRPRETAILPATIAPVRRPIPCRRSGSARERHSSRPRSSSDSRKRPSDSGGRSRSARPRKPPLSGCRRGRCGRHAGRA